MPASPTSSAYQQLILNTSFEVSGEIGPLLYDLDTFSPAPPWRRVSGDTAALRIVLIDDQGDVPSTPRRVILATGNTLTLTAKRDPADVDIALTLDFVESGTAGSEYYESDPADLSIADAVFNGEPQALLYVDFTEKDSGGTALRSWRTGLYLLRSTAGGGAPSPIYYVAYSAQSPTTQQKTNALTNLGISTDGDIIPFNRIESNTLETGATGDAYTKIGLAINDSNVIQSWWNALDSRVGYIDSFGGLYLSGSCNAEGDVVGNGNASFVGNLSCDDGNVTTDGLGALTILGLVVTNSANNGGIAIGTSASSGYVQQWKNLAGNTLVRIGTTGLFQISSDNFATTSISLSPSGTASVNYLSVGGKDVVFGGNFTMVGAFSFIGTLTGNTTVIYPTTGTLSTLAGTETLTNKTLVAPVLGTPASGNLSNCTAGTTSDAGVLVLATALEARTGTDTAKAVTPDGLRSNRLANAYRMSWSSAAWVSVVSGAGASTASTEWGQEITGPTTATGYGIRYITPSNQAPMSRGVNRGIVDWSKRVEFSGQVCFANTPDANTVVRITWGKTAADTAGDLTRQGIGIKRTSSGVIQAHAHNGSSATTGTDGTFTPTNNQGFDYIITLSSGTVTVTINDTVVASCSGGPTSAGSQAAALIQAEVQNTNTTAAQTTIGHALTTTFISRT